MKPSKEITISLAQANPTLGDFDSNSAQILDIWHDQKNNCDLLIFPELFLCGYPPEDLVNNQVFQKQAVEKIALICRATKDYKSAAIIPAPWEIDNNLYNAALLIENGTIKHIFTKNLLPNDSVFDEKRTFCHGSLPDILEFRGHKLGIMICEDLWHYGITNHLKAQNAKVLIAINGSPYSHTQHDLRLNIARKRVKETGIDLLYLNMVGGQDDLVFDGRSFIMDRNAQITYQAPAFEEKIITVKISNDTQSPDIHILNNPTDNSQICELSLTYNALKIGLGDYVHKNGFKDVILGLSGGIDSALSAAIAVDALGANHVHCVMIPSEFTSQDSLDDAKQCADFLGVKYQIIEIKEAIKIFENIIPDLNGVAHENTQSRIRGLILMAMSNMHGSMLLSTGNKSEMAVGYATLYGDMNGGFNALKDVYKTLVYDLANWRNNQNQAIPKRIITKDPSAELRPDQKDQDSLPPYELLDDILSVLIEYEHINWSAITDENILAKKKRCDKNPEVVEKIAYLLKYTEYKRRQSPLGTRITTRAFGRDRRYPITNHFINRIEKL